MKFTELEPRFVRTETRIETWTRVRPETNEHYQHTGPRHYLPHADTLAVAQGVLFLCPACFITNKGAVGTHGVLCWFRDRGVPDDVEPLPGRWAVSGTNFEDLTLSPSVLLTGDGCGWHGFVTKGDVTTC